MRQQTLCWQSRLAAKPIAIAAELVEMVLIQLVSNGLKFSENGQAVTISLSRSASHLDIIVSDQGCGIKEQEKTQIFSAFYQGKNAQDMTVQGSGLGLTIVKETVEQLRGKLYVEHNEPQGCRFIIKIPINNQKGAN